LRRELRNGDGNAITYVIKHGRGDASMSGAEIESSAPSSSLRMQIRLFLLRGALRHVYSTYIQHELNSSQPT